MKILNLVDNDKSDIKYQIINYPDGQRDIVIEKFPVLFGIPIQIKSRLNNAEDLLMIICTTKALRNFRVKEIHLYTPYIMGLRSDRLFQEGGNRYVKDIIAPILNAQNYESVTCIDAHSYVAENCINNLINLSNINLVCQVMNIELKDHNFENSILVSPDAGASHKIYKLAEQINYKGEIITCSKERDKDGKLNKCVVPFDTKKYIDDRQFEKDYIIIDDIIDGGQTFINIAKEIKNTSFFCGKIYLIVTHGIFSKGFEELSKYFDGIYTTNSYGKLESSEFGDSWIGSKEEQYYSEIPKDLVKQLNVF